MSDTERHVLR